MLVCDRCGKKIMFDNNNTKQTLFIYERAAAGNWHKVDLCKDCLIDLDDYKKRMESYFMINKDNPRDIFDKVKYWND